MKKITRFLLLVTASIFLFQTEISAQKVTSTESYVVAENFIRLRSVKLDIRSAEAFFSGTDTIAWLFRCSPAGFIIVATDKSLPPVLAWSDEGNFGEGKAWENFLPILKTDLTNRNKYANSGFREGIANMQKWNSFLSVPEVIPLFKQWPAEGTTSTEGWVETNWTQNPPYNNLCPLDGNTANRSLAGCPATAMAQILNYHHNIHQTRFTDADDYFHNYGTGNQYYIDDDWASYDFPSWATLNEYLDTLENRYNTAAAIDDTCMAALTFACGVAAKQVYSSTGSGTFGIGQAYDSYVRFAYSDARLVYPSDTNLNHDLAENIKIALPAHLGLVDAAWSVGHNVVVDGYNTDELYHFNFGWGGSANGWYTMPPTSIPYNLMVIEGIVLDINLSSPPSGFTANRNDEGSNIWYIQAANILRMKSQGNVNSANLIISDFSGKEISSTIVTFNNTGTPVDFPLKNLNKGIYLARMIMKNNKTCVCRFVKTND